MQFFEIIRVKLFHLVSMKAKEQMHNDDTNQDADNDYKCQDVCDDVKHTIPGLSSFVARSQKMNIPPFAR
jgi:hypothetical protein